MAIFQLFPVILALLSLTPVMSLTLLTLKSVVSFYLHHSLSQFEDPMAVLSESIIHFGSCIYWQKSVWKPCFAEKSAVCMCTLKRDRSLYSFLLFLKK